MSHLWLLTASRASSRYQRLLDQFETFQRCLSMIRSWSGGASHSHWGTGAIQSPHTLRSEHVQSSTLLGEDELSTHASVM